MPARFRVENTFNVRIRSIFVAHGQVVAGTVRAGQHGISPVGLDAPVDAIEWVLLSAREGRENPALCFKYRDEAELAQWQTLGLAGQTLELTDGDAGRDQGRAV